MRMILVLTASLAAGAVLGGCGGNPGTITVRGTVEIAVQDFSEFQGYPAVFAGNGQVTITDPSGKVLAVAPADDGNVSQGPRTAGDLTSTWGFTAQVPAGEASYGISVTGVPGTVRYSEAQMRKGPALCMGDACGAG